MTMLKFRNIDSPVGPLTLAGKGRRVMHLRMVDQTYEPSHDSAAAVIAMIYLCCSGLTVELPFQ